MAKRCNKCRKTFDSSVLFGDPREVKVASCRVCPANAVFAVCASCADLAQLQQGPCPSCGATAMWTVQGLVPA